MNYLKNFFCKISKRKKSFNSLHSLGCNKKGINYQVILKMYKKFSQSVFYYGLDTNYFRKECLHNLNVRQNILLKNTFGLSKFLNHSRC